MAATPDSALGEGPVRPVPVPLQRQLEQDRLRELIENAETEHGPVEQAAVEAKRALLRDDAAGPVGAF
ncbi:hypothetical protein [Streptomyces ossamyceticus]|uniref:Uncharacterized protein n=1 Tax=Streptomyces ossamyceticus TaxID=249581 RepID=A0ABV2UYN5_9ACTN